MKHPDATKKQAHALFLQGWKLTAIATETGVNERTLREWRDIDGWVRDITPEQAAEIRLAWLISKDDKSMQDWQEMKFLAELRKKYLRRAEREEGRAAAGHPVKGGRSNRRNDIDHINLAEIEGPPLFPYQCAFLADKARVRWIIKSRQIGFTYVGSWDALCTAIEHGRDQIFLSASKNQVGMFRDYVKLLAHEFLGLELKGSKEKIELHKGGKLWATLRFLSTNTATAQSYHGDVYIDEACWIPQYQTLRKVAGGMASQKQYRITIFSTPSTIVHPAWQEFTRLQKDKAAGKATRTSLTVITIHDALEQGCDLFDLEALREEYDEAAFAQLFECQPIDDEESVFKLADLEALQVDPADWKHPQGLPVFIGYDPSRFRDSATLYVVVKLASATPAHPRGKWRLYKSSGWVNKAFRWQAEQIRHGVEEYNVQGIGIDTSGHGQAVFELVQPFYPKVKAIPYTLESKAELVQSMRDLVHTKSIELPAGDVHLLHSFLAIKQVATGGGRITYKAGRTAETGHADRFFAAAHAVSFEPLRPRKKRALIVG